MKKQMKILHFHPDGRMAQKFVDPLMEAELKSEYKSNIIISSNQQFKGQLVIPFDLCVKNLIKLPYAAIKIFIYYKKNKPNIVISHNSKSSFIPLLVAWCAGINTRVYFNHGVPFIGYAGILKWGLKMLERINLKLTTNIITVSQDMQELLSGISKDKNPRIIHTGSASGLDLELYNVRPYNLEYLRQKYNLSKDDTVIVYAGRSEKRKGVDLALRLWLEYFQSSQYAHFKLITCGPDRRDLEKLIDVPIPKNVIPLGFIDNIPEVLFISDAIILPSLHEGLSYVCMEAQASGVVVIANDIRGIRCLVNDKISGFLVKENNLKIYAEIIRGIKQDKNANFNMKKRARNNIEQYSRELFMPKYLQYLLELTNIT